MPVAFFYYQTGKFYFYTDCASVIIQLHWRKSRKLSGLYRHYAGINQANLEIQLALKIIWTDANMVCFTFLFLFAEREYPDIYPMGANSELGWGQSLVKIYDNPARFPGAQLIAGATHEQWQH